MKKIFLISLLALGFTAFSQDSLLYHPLANAPLEINAAVKQAKQEKKYMLIQGGGNWCSWCIEFARFAKADPQIDSIIKADFIWYHLNYSKENKNTKTFAKYDYPERFGFPVLIILNEKGKRIHTQNSEYLEDGKKSYDKNKVLSFLKSWSPKALDPTKYKSK